MPRSSVQRVAAGRDAVYASIYENVTGSIRAFKRDPASGAWSETRLDLPAGGSTSISSANEFGPEAYFTYSGFLTPTTLFSDKGEGQPKPIKSLPARFDATPYQEAQYEAVSKDGTRIPYFVVRAEERDRPGPDAALRLWRLRDFADAVLLDRHGPALAAPGRRPMRSPISAAAASSGRPGTMRRSS